MTIKGFSRPRRSGRPLCSIRWRRCWPNFRRNLDSPAPFPSCDESAGSALDARRALEGAGAPQPRGAVAMHAALNRRTVPPSTARPTRQGLPHPPCGLAMTDAPQVRSSSRDCFLPRHREAQRRGDPYGLEPQNRPAIHSRYKSTPCFAGLKALARNESPRLPASGVPNRARSWHAEV